MTHQRKVVLNGSDTASPSGAVYRERRPVRPHPLVECSWEQRADSGGHVQRVLPDACADVIVSSSGEATVVGPATSVQLPRLSGGERLRGLRFRTAAIGPALGLPAYELRDLQMPLRELFPACEAGRIADQVWRGELPSFLDPGVRERRVEHALASLRRQTRVGAIAEDLGVSARHLRRLVLAHTGLEPRTLSRIMRFQRFLDLSDRAAEPFLADLAARAGYADQAHLTREVRALSGLTPTALLAERRLA